MKIKNKIIEKGNNKIKKDFNKMRWVRCINPLSKFFGVKIKPYLDETEIIAATEMCIDNFFKHEVEATKESEFGRFEVYPNVKIIFKMFVLDQCTNIDFNDEYSSNLFNSGIINYISKKVKNYNEVWEMILESIRLKNTFVGLNIIANMIPNPDEMDKNIDNMVSSLKELSDKDPQSFRKMVEMFALNNAYNDGVDEFNTSINEEKKKNLS